MTAPDDNPAPASAAAPPPPVGRIDIHSHLLPGIDDGCVDTLESFVAIDRLKKAGFVGSICTPHVWPDLFPHNTPDHIDAWVEQLRQQIAEQGLDYHVWPGGEVRMFDGVVDWFEEHGVPTLAGSRCVLTDFWVDRWPRWAADGYRWLIDHKYRPILAHPERINCPRDLPARLAELAQMGVLMQGNFRCMTGEEGYGPDRLVRQFLTEKRYTFMALDMHRPETIEGRLDGMQLVAAEFGDTLLEEFTEAAPRRVIWGQKA